MLQCRDISKAYPGVKSLDGVSLEVEAGEIHALLGENGAGKSTLVGVISGAVSPDGGSIALDGQPARWASALEARKVGIHVVHQELALFPGLSVAQNIFLGEEPKNRFGLIDHARLRSNAAAILADLGTHIPVDKLVGELAIADQQMVEIAKAFTGFVKLLILDEPTAVISGREADLLFTRLRRLREQGVAIIYISHRLEEVFELADRVTVLKDGRYVGTERVADIDRRMLIRMMVGRELQDLYPPKARARAESQSVFGVLREIAARGRDFRRCLARRRQHRAGRAAGAVGIRA